MSRNLNTKIDVTISYLLTYCFDVAVETFKYAVRIVKYPFKLLSLIFLLM